MDDRQGRALAAPAAPSSLPGRIAQPGGRSPSAPETPSLAALTAAFRCAYP